MFKSIASFFGKVKDVFANLYAHAPSAAQTVNTTIKLCAPIITALVQKVAGTEAADVANSVIKEIESDLAVVNLTIQATGLSGTGLSTVTTSVQAVQSNLSGLLQMVHVKNPALTANIQGDVDFVQSELGAVIEVLKNYKPAAA